LSFYCHGVAKTTLKLNLLTTLIFVSSLSFMAYGCAYFISTKMKSEFRRFGLPKIGTFIAILELMGAFGLLIGLKYPLILSLSAAGLATLMFFGVAFRIKFKDTLWVTLPALVFMLLNASIFYLSLHMYGISSAI
jgi:hypothetical protein